MKNILAVFAVAIFFSQLSYAQIFEKGSQELGFGFDFTSAKDLKTTNLSADWGYHFEPEHQGSVLFSHSKTKLGSFDSSGGFLGLGYDYNILDFKKDIIPYLGGGFKIPLADFQDIYDNVLFVHGGFKFFVAKRTAVRLSLDIERYAGADNYESSTAIALRAGYILTFGPRSGGSVKKTQSANKAPAKQSGGLKKN